MLNGAAALETAGVHGGADRQVRHPRGLQPLRRRLGARDGHARTSGPSRSPPTGAAPATARSSTGRTASRPRASSAPSSATSSTSPRPCSRPPGCPSRSSSTACSRCRSRARSMAYTFDDAGRRRAPRDPVLRDVRQPRHLPQGLDGGDQAQHALGDRRTELPPFDDDVWELYDARRLDPGARPRARAAGEAARAAAAVPDRGRAATTCCRSTTGASSASTPTWPAGHSSIRGNSQMLFGGMGRLSENSVVNIKNKSHAVTAEIERARRAAPRA